jgi:hypothetical protein
VLLRSGVDTLAVADALPRVDASRVPVWQAAWWFRIWWAPGIKAIALPWGIYVAPSVLRRPLAALGPLIVHELTHIEQWRRLGPLGWARSYLGDYRTGRGRGLPHREAYLAIGLEIEARAMAARLGRTQ